MPDPKPAAPKPDMNDPVTAALFSFKAAPNNEQIDAKAYQLLRQFGPEVAERFEKEAKRLSPKATYVEIGEAQVDPKVEIGEATIESRGGKPVGNGYMPEGTSDAAYQALMSFKVAPGPQEIDAKAKELEAAGNPQAAAEFRKLAAELSPRAKAAAPAAPAAPSKEGPPKSEEQGLVEKVRGALGITPDLRRRLRSAVRLSNPGPEARMVPMPNRGPADQGQATLLPNVTKTAGPRVGQTVVGEVGAEPDYLVDMEQTGPYEQPYTDGEPSLVGGARKLIRLLPGETDDEKRMSFRYPYDTWKPM